MTAAANPESLQAGRLLGRSGLSEPEAAARLLADGPNELPRSNGRTVLRIVVDVVREPMIALLVAAGFIYLLLGDLHEALILVAFACLSIVITVVQETRTEHALEALRDLTSPHALVIRDGMRKRIPSREVVSGDLVLLREGDRVPADGWLCECDGLHIDESLLTGESVAVRKSACGPNPPDKLERPGGDDLPFVYSGTLVVRGSGCCSVTATGTASEIGRIGQVLSTLETETPRLREQTRRVVLWFAAIGATASLLAIVLYGMFRGSWLEATLAGIALGMSMLPEEFPVVLTIFMAMGAMRMSGERVLTRRAAAIETLGSATVLCTDKTGTLTQNRMRIAELHLPDGRVLVRDGVGDLQPEDGFHLLAELGILASAQQASDPMEVAFHELGDQHAPDTVRRRQQAGWTLHRHYPLDPELLAMSHVWGNDAQGNERIVATKGAPEAIADLCGLSADARSALNETVDAMAASGLRVLGIADARWPDRDLPMSQREFSFNFRGLVGLADPLRPSVPDAVRLCRQAGIRVVMITGDYPQTARAIAEQAGIDAGDILTGNDLAAMDDRELQQRIASVRIWARIMPEQKLRLVEALKAAGEVVAMTGDGVNDAPSLKAAHIGIAMGGRGTDVAREASAIILLDDDFGSIVKAMRMGRRIYDNLRKAMGFIIAVHIPVASMALLPLLTGMPLLLGPIHIAFIEMIIDPVCSLAFEAEVEEKDVMQRPPRRVDTPLLSRRLVFWSLIQGAVITGFTGGLTLYFWHSGLEAQQLRAAAFIALVLGITGLILINRRFSASVTSALRRPNPALGWVLGGVAIILLATQFVAPVTSLFAFTPVGMHEMAVIVVASIVAVLMLERVKPMWRSLLLE
ncbi:cation-translocating P-type ATPase [Sphingobium sp. DEHP117]|uniref:cation-translocating P-type ATPase n=1 Tax=Sphingobium sp. DEHP117 TaxID=2993436 RepID=UPI0027D701E7|nr:HAD-IC family P-type ATPase [Sphingobium sp. DEHP117]MDQ4419488.1 cation-translocating P-type ATPase [Sphingobium sp. DEHP117]